MDFVVPEQEFIRAWLKQETQRERARVSVCVRVRDAERAERGERERMSDACLYAFVQKSCNPYAVLYKWK